MPGISREYILVRYEMNSAAPTKLRENMYCHPELMPHLEGFNELRTHIGGSCTAGRWFFSCQGLYLDKQVVISCNGAGMD
jgi:hypothetical protein